jgi:hypothetical protein
MRRGAAGEDRFCFPMPRSGAPKAKRRGVKPATAKKKKDNITRVMEDASSSLPNDLLRRVYAECMRIKNDDNRSALVAKLKTAILDFSKIEYVDESATVEFQFPGIGRARMDVDAYKGTRRKKALMITVGGRDTAAPVVYGGIFLDNSSGAWIASTEPFGSTAGANLAFESLRALMDEVAEGVVEEHNESKKQTFDRRRMAPDFVRAKASEMGPKAAAAFLGISVYRLERIANIV